MESTKTKIIETLVEIGAVKFGEFTLKSGIKSPVYLDLRIIISYPELLKNIATALIDLSKDLKFERIAGIPYTALPIATAFSLNSGLPMVYSRKEKKAYGTGKQIEGTWQEGDRVLIIDDLITDGGSKFETFKVFEDAGLKVENVIVLIDRKQGGEQKLEKAGYQLFSIISIFEILEYMRDKGKIESDEYEKIIQFLNTPIS